MTWRIFPSTKPTPLIRANSDSGKINEKYPPKNITGKSCDYSQLVFRLDFYILDKIEALFLLHNVYILLREPAKVNC